MRHWPALVHLSASATYDPPEADASTSLPGTSEGYGRGVSPRAAKVAELAAQELQMAPAEVVEAEQEVAWVERQSAAEIA
jgi:hypothetical protein